jgi:hypothetical protein
MSLSDFNRAIAATIIDDQPFYLINTGEMPWQLGKGCPQRVFFVIARNLDNQFRHR